MLITILCSKQNCYETLSGPVATKQLVQSITETDSNGKSFLKIPVESENVVANVLQLIGGFFGGNKLS